MKKALIRTAQAIFTIAILLLLAEMFFPERIRGSKAAVSKVGAALLLLALCAWPHSVGAAPSDALRAYRSGNFTNALAEYQSLAQARTNDLRFIFNAGTAAYRATNYDEALNDFKTVAASPDLKLQQMAFYNLGNTEYRQGELKFEPSSGSLDNVEAAWKEAMQSYTNAYQLNTNDLDAAFNLNFVKQQLGLIAELRDAMRRAKEEADEAVRRNEYHRALEVLESLNNPIANKKFQDYVKKLKDIDAIVTPGQR